MRKSIAFVFLVPAGAIVAIIYALGVPLHDSLVAGAIFGLVYMIVFLTLFESCVPKATRSAFLEVLGGRWGLTREFYGDLKDRPYDHCYYDKSAEFPGWYENDDRFRNRLAKRMRRNE